jgi:hypothetical protein
MTMESCEVGAAFQRGRYFADLDEVDFHVVGKFGALAHRDGRCCHCGARERSSRIRNPRSLSMDIAPRDDPQ